MGEWIGEADTLYRMQPRALIRTFGVSDGRFGIQQLSLDNCTVATIISRNRSIPHK